MAMHNTNSLLKYVVPSVLLIALLALIGSFFNSPQQEREKALAQPFPVSNKAAHDSAAESLDTLTAELSETKREISTVAKNNEDLIKQNQELKAKVDSKNNETTSQLSVELQALKEQVQALDHKKSEDYTIGGASSVEVITVVPDLTQGSTKEQGLNLFSNKSQSADSAHPNPEQDKLVPNYTIPANATSVRDHLMTALVGRIPVKGIVTDPYPFKIIISDDNLAANGLRIPHLKQMVVSGYCEGDLNLISVRGWVTSLTFVFDDGTISTTTSNDNNIGDFTKSNSLGYLSDQYGNPFIRGKLITNAPVYLSGNVALGVATGAANAYSQSQTTNTTSFLGNTNISVTGSQGKFIAGQAASSGMSEAEKWWHDREQQSFDAIYVAPADEKGTVVEIAVNFAKEIHIDYNPKGRKLNYAQSDRAYHHAHLD